MATLRGPLLYESGNQPSQITIEFDFPIFQYAELNFSQLERIIVQREIASRYKKEKTFRGKEYVIDISDCEFIGDNDLHKRLKYLTGLFVSGDAMTRMSLDDLSFLVKVSIKTSGSESLQELKVIDLTTAQNSTKSISAAGTSPSLTFFFVNKNAYDALTDLLNIGVFNNVLLAAIFQTTNRNPENGALTISPETFYDSLSRNLTMVYQQVAESQREAYLKRIPDLLERIKDFKLDSLFEFPISVSYTESKILQTGGDFTIQSNASEAISVADLAFYELSLNYGTDDSFKSIPFVWSKVSEVSGNVPVPFSFSIPDFTQDLFTIQVKSGIDGSILWQKDFKTSDPNIDKIQITVPLIRPNSVSVNQTASTGVTKKLRGKVIQMGQTYALKDLTVLIQAKKEGDLLWRIVGAATTDHSGNFSLPYPFGKYTEAQAVLSLTPNTPTNIAVSSEKDKESISDDFLYLLLSTDMLPSEKDEDECGCNDSKKPKRLPDQQDLIESDEYTQDVGGGCMTLTTPNRTLREYEYQAIVRISDPDVANYILEKITDNKGGIKYNLKGGTSTIKRSTISLDNPVRWQDSPDSQSNLSLYQAVSVATGHILHYKSVFKADGYSLGELLYSLPLAPGQKKQIVVFDSSHSLIGAESQTISQGESLSASLINDRSITDQISGTIGEAMSGRSDASTSGISAGLGVAGSMGAFGGSLGVAGGYANANSSASQNSSRNISQFFGERLRQSIMQNAASYRQLNATVVTTVKEGQEYAVTTEAVANHNHCHSVTMMYFEVLRHYAIFQELSYVEECVFVPLLMTNFTAENISKWKDILASRLLAVPSNTYLQPFKFLMIGRQHPLLKAFDANDRIKTAYANVEYPNGRFADEKMNEINGQLRLRVHIPRPKTRFDRILSFPVIKKTITSRGDVDVAGTVRDNIKDSIIGAVVPCAAKGPSIKYDTVSTEVLTRGAIFDMFMTLDANYETVPPAQCIRVNFETIDIFDTPFSLFFQGDVSPTPLDFFAGMEKEKALWTAYANILGITVKELFKYFNNNVVADWDRIFNEHIAPLIVEKLVRESTITINPVGPLDISSTQKYNGGDRVLSYSLLGTTSLKRSDVEKIKINFNSPLSGTQKDVFFNFVTFNIESITLNYTTNFSSGSIIRRSISNDLRDGVPEIYTPLNSDEKRNPRNEDKLLVRQLLEHLNSNLEYYNKILWYNLDPDRRFMLLDGFNIQIFNESGAPIGYRSLASVVKNQLISVAGNSLIFPVAAGYRVSQSYILAVDPETETTEEVSLLDHYKPLTPVPPYRISAPTRGVFMEAIMGQCDSCEKVKPNSSQDWTKFNVDEPTSIAPVTTPTPTITDWKAAFKDFAAPIVNIQNAPDTPAPGVGLATLSELLGKAGIFNDITGLQGNQQNAIKTYLSNNENVRAMAEMAKGLAMQQHNTQNSQAITDSITNARASGAISQEEENSLVRQHLQNQIDGGESTREATRSARERERPSLTEAAIEAAGSGRSVSAQRTDLEGNQESIAISGEGQSTAQSVNIEYNVPLLQQPSSSVCWATAATMMVNWKNQSSSSIPNVMLEAGRNLIPADENRYLNKFNSNQALLSSEKPDFIAALGMVGEAPANYPLSQYILWMQTYGPLWVTTDAATATGTFSPHARILTKIAGPNVNDPATMMFTFNDPATGQAFTINFTQFVDAFEQMVTDNPGDLFIQVVHFAARLLGADGNQSTRAWLSGVPANMSTFKSALVTNVNSEYTHWHTGGSHPGSAWWETDNDAHVLNKLTSYWTAAFNTNAQGDASSQITPAQASIFISNKDPWSAAFISFIVTQAGITSNALFVHSIRHVDFIAKSILNKENHVYGNPFWGYRINEHAPLVGDIVGRSASINYNNVVNRSTGAVRRGASHSDIVIEKNTDHIIVVGGNLELDAVRTARTGTSWTNSITPENQNNVCVGKRKIYLTEDGKIDTTKTWEIFDNTSGTYESRVQFTGPQSDYFVVIKVRTDVNVN